MRATEILAEASYEDIYPKSFVEFRERWLAVPREEWGGLYVNFSDYASDELQKTAHATPDHRDPAAVYGYPLDYVLDHPADVWYGQRAKFMRVLRSKAKSVLDLQTPLTFDEAVDLLSRIDLRPRQYFWHRHPHSPSEFLKLAASRFRYIGPLKWVKAMFSVVQCRLQYHEKTRMFDAIEQTQRLRQMGFDAVEDRAVDEFAAVVNSREPEQMMFLVRSAFEVVETITLRAMKTPGSQKMTFIDTKDAMPKLAALICRAIGETPAGSLTVYHRFMAYTKSGLRLVLVPGFAEMPRSTIKPHRGAGADTRETTTVEIEGDGAPYKRTFPADWTFERIAKAVGADLGNVPALSGNHSMLQDHPEIGKDFDAWAVLARHYGVPWPSAEKTNPSNMVLVHTATRDIDLALLRSGSASKKPKLDEITELLTRFWSAHRPSPFRDAMLAIMTRFIKDRKIKMDVRFHAGSIGELADLLSRGGAPSGV